MPTSDNLLEVNALSVSYGHVRAIQEVSLSVEPGQTLVLLGSNGAGKSSLLRAISGLAPRTSGNVVLRGRTMERLPPHRVARAGIAHVPEGRRSIGSLSVEENLLVAALASKRTPRREVPSALKSAYSLFPKLAERKNQPANLMSGGEQQMLAIARGLVASPEVLLIDEPSMGLAPIMITEIYKSLATREGALSEVAIVLTEQGVRLALPLADHVHILSRGVTVFDGGPDEISEEDALAAYLGEHGESDVAEGARGSSA